MNRAISFDPECEDWRVLRVGPEHIRFNDAEGKLFDGTAIVMLADEKKIGENKVFFPTPSPSALCLDLSRKLYIESEVILDRYLKDSQVTIPPLGGLMLKSEDIFEYFERYMGSVVFAHNALEAFVNLELPESYVYIETDKKNTRHYSKPQIERWHNLDTKLGVILPDALKIESPKQAPVWHNFKRLEEIRHDIIHMKTADVHFQFGNTPTVWNRLLERSPFMAHVVAKELIGYFYTKVGSSPRWFQKIPF